MKKLTAISLFLALFSVSGYSQGGRFSQFLSVEGKYVSIKKDTIAIKPFTFKQPVLVTLTTDSIVVTQHKKYKSFKVVNIIPKTFAPYMFTVYTEPSNVFSFCTTPENGNIYAVSFLTKKGFLLKKNVEVIYY